MKRNWGLILAYALIVLTMTFGLRYVREHGDRNTVALCDTIVTITTPIPTPTDPDAGGRERVRVRNVQLAEERATLLHKLGKTETC